MQDQPIQLRPIAVEWAALVEPAYKAIAPIAADLFQARKCGITVSLPEGVRQQMMATHGDEARDVLALIDGRVYL